MKEISKVKAYMKKAIKSIIMERHILKHIHHKFITNLYFSFQDKDNLYFILDYFSGGDLRFYLKKNVQFDERQIKFIVSNVIIGLRYLHNNNILHRDVKPENLIFDNKGYINLADFGISKKIENNKSIKERSGTPGYLSPEIILKKNQTFVCDYFSLGIVLYELIFLKRPFNGRNKEEIFDSILNKTIKLKKKNLPTIFYNSPSCNELLDFMNRILKKKAEERLGANGTKELMEHPWLKGIDWEKMELKSYDIDDIPFVPFPEDNFDLLTINSKINEKECDYNSYLKLINNSTLFTNFYFNSFTSNNRRKVLSSDNLRHKKIIEKKDSNSSNRIILYSLSHNSSFNNIKNCKNEIDNTNDESSESNEYTLGEYNFEEDDDLSFNEEKNDKIISETIKNKKMSFSSNTNIKQLNEQNKKDKYRNSIF